MSPRVVIVILKLEYVILSPSAETCLKDSATANMRISWWLSVCFREGVSLTMVWNWVTGLQDVSTYINIQKTM